MIDSIRVLIIAAGGFAIFLLYKVYKDLKNDLKDARLKNLDFDRAKNEEYAKSSDLSKLVDDANVENRKRNGSGSNP